MVKLGGCNDCHTPGYAQTGGHVPERLWLTGDTVGFQEPWGTTYPVNLRLLFQGMTEAQWVRHARVTQSRPPMPWFTLHHMSDRDLQAVYRYVRYLGPAGDPAPTYVPPGNEPRTPYIVFVPQNPTRRVRWMGQTGPQATCGARP